MLVNHLLEDSLGLAYRQGALQLTLWWGDFVVSIRQRNPILCERLVAGPILGSYGNRNVVMGYWVVLLTRRLLVMHWTLIMPWRLMLKPRTIFIKWGNLFRPWAELIPWRLMSRRIPMTIKLTHQVTVAWCLHHHAALVSILQANRVVNIRSIRLV